jgi:hypothetical protein
VTKLASMESLRRPETVACHESSNAIVLWGTRLRLLLPAAGAYETGPVPGMGALAGGLAVF